MEMSKIIIPRQKRIVTYEEGIVILKTTTQKRRLNLWPANLYSVHKNCAAEPQQQKGPFTLQNIKTLNAIMRIHHRDAQNVMERNMEYFAGIIEIAEEANNALIDSKDRSLRKETTKECDSMMLHIKELEKITRKPRSRYEVDNINIDYQRKA